MSPRCGPGPRLRGWGLYDDEGLGRSAPVSPKAPGAADEGRGRHTPRGARRRGRGRLFRGGFAVGAGGWSDQGGPFPGQRTSWALDEERRRTERRRERFGNTGSAPCATRDLRPRRPGTASRPQDPQLPAEHHRAPAGGGSRVRGGRLCPRRAPARGHDVEPRGRSGRNSSDPPLGDRVLGGVAREVLLEEGAVREGNLLADVSGPLYCLNSIHGIEPVVELDGRPLRSDAKFRSRLDGVLARRSEFR